MKLKCTSCNWVGTEKEMNNQAYPGQFEDEHYRTCPKCGSDEVAPLTPNIKEVSK